MKPFNKRRKLLVTRVICSTLVVSFLGSDLLLASSLQGVQNSPFLAPGVKADLLSDVRLLDVPAQYCQYKEAYQAPAVNGVAAPLILLLQDAHANLSGQENLAKTLEALMKRYDFQDIFVEGGEGDVSLGVLRELSDASSMKRVAGRFLRDAEIAGEEYLNLTSSFPMKLTGVEDIELYAKGLKAYAALADKREAILLYLGKSRAAVEKLKKRYYSHALLAYEKKSSQAPSVDGLIGLARAHGVDFSSFVQITRLAGVLNEEKKIDFNLARLELAAVYQKIGDKDSDGLMRQLAAQSQEKNAAQPILIQKVKKAALEHGVSLDSFPNFQKYAEYLDAFSAIDMEKTLEETTRLEETLYTRLLESKTAQTLRAIDRYLKLLETAYRIQMTSDEFALFLENTPAFPTISWQAFLNRALVEEGIADSLIPLEKSLEEGRTALEAFYRAVDERDFAFVNNIEKFQTENGNLKIAALIAGGYHTQHLSKLLKEKGYSYAVLSPVVTQATDQSKYERVLLSPLGSKPKTIETVNGRTPIAGVDGSKVFSAAGRKSFVEPMLAPYQRSLSSNVKQFRMEFVTRQDRLKQALLPTTSAARLASAQLILSGIEDVTWDYSLEIVTDSQVSPQHYLITVKVVPYYRVDGRAGSKQILLNNYEVPFYPSIEGTQHLLNVLMAAINRSKSLNRITQKSEVTRDFAIQLINEALASTEMKNRVSAKEGDNRSPMSARLADRPLSSDTVRALYRQMLRKLRDSQQLKTPQELDRAENERHWNRLAQQRLAASARAFEDGLNRILRHRGARLASVQKETETLGPDGVYLNVTVQGQQKDPKKFQISVRDREGVKLVDHYELALSTEVTQEVLLNRIITRLQQRFKRLSADLINRERVLNILQSFSSSAGDVRLEDLIEQPDPTAARLAAIETADYAERFVWPVNTNGFDLFVKAAGELETNNKIYLIDLNLHLVPADSMDTTRFDKELLIGYRVEVAGPMSAGDLADRIAGVMTEGRNNLRGEGDFTPDFLISIIDEVSGSASAARLATVTSPGSFPDDVSELKTNVDRAMKNLADQNFTDFSLLGPTFEWALSQDKIVFESLIETVRANRDNKFDPALVGILTDRNDDLGTDNFAKSRAILMLLAAVSSGQSLARGNARLYGLTPVPAWGEQIADYISTSTVAARLANSATVDIDGFEVTATEVRATEGNKGIIIQWPSIQTSMMFHEPGMKWSAKIDGKRILVRNIQEMKRALTTLIRETGLPISYDSSDDKNSRLSPGPIRLYDSDRTRFYDFRWNDVNEFAAALKWVVQATPAAPLRDSTITVAPNKSINLALEKKPKGGIVHAHRVSTGHTELMPETVVLLKRSPKAGRDAQIVTMNELHRALKNLVRQWKLPVEISQLEYSVIGSQEGLKIRHFLVKVGNRGVILQKPFINYGDTEYPFEARTIEEFSNLLNLILTPTAARLAATATTPSRRSFLKATAAAGAATVVTGSTKLALPDTVVYELNPITGVAAIKVNNLPEEVSNLAAVVYQPTQGEKHISYYTGGNMPELLAALLPENNPLFKQAGFKGLKQFAKNDAAKLKAAGFNKIRLYYLPTNAAEAAGVKAIMNEVYKITGGKKGGTRVMIGHWAGFWDLPGSPQLTADNASQIKALEESVASLVKTYAGEPWVESWAIGNELNYHVEGGKFNWRVFPTSLERYYEIMTRLAIAGQKAEALTSRDGKNRHPFILVNGGLTAEEAGLFTQFNEQSKSQLKGRTAWDALGVNFYPGVDWDRKTFDPNRIKADVDELFRNAATVNLPVVITEVGFWSDPNGPGRQPEFFQALAPALATQRLLIGSNVFEWTSEGWKPIESKRAEEGRFGIVNNASTMINFVGMNRKMGPFGEQEDKEPMKAEDLAQEGGEAKDIWAEGIAGQYASGANRAFWKDYQPAQKLQPGDTVVITLTSSAKGKVGIQFVPTILSAPTYSTMDIQNVKKGENVIRIKITKATTFERLTLQVGRETFKPGNLNVSGEIQVDVEKVEVTHKKKSGARLAKVIESLGEMRGLIDVQIAPRESQAPHDRDSEALQYILHLILIRDGVVAALKKINNKSYNLEEANALMDALTQLIDPRKGAFTGDATNILSEDGFDIGLMRELATRLRKEMGEGLSVVIPSAQPSSSGVDKIMQPMAARLAVSPEAQVLIQPRLFSGSAAVARPSVAAIDSDLVESLSPETRAILTLVLQRKLLENVSAMDLEGVAAKVSLAGNRLLISDADDIPLGYFDITVDDIEAAKAMTSANAQENKDVMADLQQTNAALAAFRAETALHDNPLLAGVVVDVSDISEMTDLEAQDIYLTALFNDMISLSNLVRDNNFYFRVIGASDAFLAKMKARPEMDVLLSLKTLSLERRSDVSGQPAQEVALATLSHIDNLAALMGSQTAPGYLPAESTQAGGHVNFKARLLLAMTGARGFSEAFVRAYAMQLPSNIGVDSAQLTESLKAFLAGDTKPKTLLAAAQFALRPLLTRMGEELRSLYGRLRSVWSAA